jgi:response regulator RpfG family c-di-GMP phosphodiesterase
MIRSDSEWFFGLDLDGQFTMSAGRTGRIGRPAPEGIQTLLRSGLTGWVEFSDGAETHVGQAFYFQPFAWYMIVADKRSAIFASARGITIALVSVLLASIALTIVVLLVLSASITRPITEVTAGMSSIIESNDFGRRVEIEVDDESAVLAAQFNLLCGELQRSYDRIRKIALRESAAGIEVVLREQETLLALGRAAEFRDHETLDHTIRVARYAKVLCETLIEDDELRLHIYYAAPLHDIGKLGIPEAILLKPAPLDAGEWATIQTHTTMGRDILARGHSVYLEMGASIAISHHERFDGTGYPNRLAGAAIPIEGRILAVADVFDALISPRPYKAAWDVAAALDYLAANRATHFDPAVVDAFLENSGKMIAIAQG